VNIHVPAPPGPEVGSRVRLGQQRPFGQVIEWTLWSLVWGHREFGPGRYELGLGSKGTIQQALQDVWFFWTDSRKTPREGFGIRRCCKSRIALPLFIFVRIRVVTTHKSPELLDMAADSLIPLQSTAFHVLLPVDYASFHASSPGSRGEAMSP
jgi:hypothetical protein